MKKLEEELKYQRLELEEELPKELYEIMNYIPVLPVIRELEDD